MTSVRGEVRATEIRACHGMKDSSSLAIIFRLCVGFTIFICEVLWLHDCSVFKRSVWFGSLVSMQLCNAYTNHNLPYDLKFPVVYLLVLHVVLFSIILFLVEALLTSYSHFHVKTFQNNLAYMP